MKILKLGDKQFEGKTLIKHNDTEEYEEITEKVGRKQSTLLPLLFQQPDLIFDTVYIRRLESVAGNRLSMCAFAARAPAAEVLFRPVKLGRHVLCQNLYTPPKTWGDCPAYRRHERQSQYQPRNDGGRPPIALDFGLTEVRGLRRRRRYLQNTHQQISSCMGYEILAKIHRRRYLHSRRGRSRINALNGP